MFALISELVTWENTTNEEVLNRARAEIRRSWRRCCGDNAPHRFRVVQVSVEGDRVSPPVYVSGVDWGLPGFGDSQITKNLQQLLAAGRVPH